MSNITITTKHTPTTKTLSFILTGESGTDGYSNITIPKDSVNYGSAPAIYIDNKPAQNQSYTQDTTYIYVWYTTHFSTHQVTIELVIPSAPITTSLGSFIAVTIVTPEIILVYIAIAIGRIRRKPDFA
jgi:hypothetical protein